MFSILISVTWCRKRERKLLRRSVEEVWIERSSSCSSPLSACGVSFHSEGPGELGLRAGDIVNNVEQIDREWYLGTSKGITGFFPINYVKVLVRAEAEEHAGKRWGDKSQMIHNFCL